MSFDLDRFTAECRAALAETNPQGAVRAVTARALADPDAVLKAVGEPAQAGITTLYHAPDLTLLNVVWGPYMTLIPHNHLTWAVIGIYTGREDNIFWRRIPMTGGSRIEAAGARALSRGDADLLGKDIIHSVTNPIGRLTGAIHIYGGDFFASDRSQWDAETLEEENYDGDRVRRIFAAANGLR